MFRSIQSKLILVDLLLVLVAMQLSGAYLINQLEQAYVSQIQDDLHQSAQLLVGHLSGYTVDGQLDEASVAEFVAGWPGNVLVLDANSTVIAASLKDASNRELIGKKLTHDDISPALIGQETRRTGQENGKPTAFETLPITVDDEVVGVLYLKASLEEAYRRLGDIREVFLVATLLALGSSAILGVALARTITGPVREVTRTAARIAGGDFGQFIRVRSSDEIGQLGEMFNRMTSRLRQTLEEVRGEKNKVEAILAHMADGLLALDAQGRISKLNPAAERMLRVSEPEVLGRLPDEVWPGIGLAESVAWARKENRSLTREIHRGPQTLLAHVTPLQGEGSDSAGTVVVFHDITELQRLEAMRREFVADVSHELKTPLTTVKSYVETLLDGAAEVPEVRDQFLRVVQAETDRMTRLVRDLLQLSQLDQGQARWDVRPTSMANLVEESLSRLQVPLEQKRQRVNLIFHPDTPLAKVDREKLQQVLVNLLANAIEFTPAEGEITVEVEPADSMVRVTVRDTGIGIPPEDLPRIFERFYRVDKARSRMLGGTGLGLAIAKQIVELSGGTIAIASEVGKGTEVVFTVPAAPTGDEVG
ncbi:MAG TPA: ATP-binding protein [Symbiobacteriaceae bacterium]